MEHVPDLAAAADDELLVAARAGDASAFAVLLRRHASRFADLAATPDGDRALVRLGVRAMRELPRLAPGRRAEEWLDALAAAERERHGTADPSELLSTSAASDPRDWLDRWWSELSVRWPTGRRPRRLPGWARATLAAAILVAAGIVGTTALLAERPAPPLVAQVQAYAEPARGDDFAPEDDPDADELPVFELPDEEPVPPTEPAPDTTTPDVPEADAPVTDGGDATEAEPGE